MAKPKPLTAVQRARKYAALQDERAKLVRTWEDIGLEIQDLDDQLKRMER